MPTIDADAHVVEMRTHLGLTWSRPIKNTGPRIVRPTGEGGAEYWFIDGKIRGLVRIVMTAQEMADVSERTGRDMRTPKETREMENVAARLSHMDELGIDIQVLYPTMFIEQITEKPAWEVADLQRLQPLACRHLSASSRAAEVDMCFAAARHERVTGGTQVLRAAWRLRRVHARHRRPSPDHRSLFLSALR